ncbi:MAG: serine/threonine protein kinase [Rhodobacteraceae bacterium]|nr:serine/threonine protein kinase [Paracoccaceae bacterium]
MKPVDESQGAEAQVGFADELKPGSALLAGQYTISGFLNAGGFGITYLAKDSLDRTVVIKECFPGAMCCRRVSTVQVRSRAHAEEFAAVVKHFRLEARSLAKLEHRNIVGVHQVFDDNDTSYMALDFVRGRDLLDLIEDPSVYFSPTEVKSMLLNLLDAIGYVHSRDILHRDISPDNILVDEQGEPILIDFGAAREEATRQSRVLSALHTVKDGYSPQEFYLSGSSQVPSSDLYALGASFYHLITGEAPPNSQTRVSAIAEDKPDPYVPLSTGVPGYDWFFLDALDRALAVFPKDRLQTAQEWITAIDEEKRRKQALEVAKHDKAMEQSIFKIVAETNEGLQPGKRKPKPSRLGDMPQPSAPNMRSAAQPSAMQPEHPHDAAPRAGAKKPPRRSLLSFNFSVPRWRSKNRTPAESDVNGKAER